jgi:hemerythrin
MEHNDNKETLIWRSEYNINNFKIDTEHQKLFSIAREAINISKLKDDLEINTKLKEIITKLFDYVDYHFKNEEEYMNEISYPEFQNHKILHENILEMLKKLISEINTLELSEIQKTLQEFIENYVIKHILKEDKKILLWNTSLDDLKTNFGWKEIYSLNNLDLDNEHKTLFNIAEEAFAVVEPELKHGKIKDILNRLYEYMKIHFSHEEEYMQEINYPSLEIHKELHENIVNTINDFVKQLPNLSEDSFEKELARLIDTTLIHHIIQEDKKIITWLKANSSAS